MPSLNSNEFPYFRTGTKYARTGKVAAIYSLTKNPERETYYHFTEPLSAVKDIFFKLKEKEISWNIMADLSDYRVGVGAGYNYDDIFMNAVKNGILKNIDTVRANPMELTMLEMIKGDRPAFRIDLGICEISACRYLIRKHSPKFDRRNTMIDYIDGPIGGVRPCYMGISKKRPEAEAPVETFNAELAGFMAEWKHRAIFEKYDAIIDLWKE